MHARVDLRGPRFKKINQKKKQMGHSFFVVIRVLLSYFVSFSLFFSILFDVCCCLLLVACCFACCRWFCALLPHLIIKLLPLIITNILYNSKQRHDTTQAAHHTHDGECVLRPDDHHTCTFMKIKVVCCLIFFT